MANSNIHTSDGTLSTYCVGVGVPFCLDFQDNCFIDKWVEESLKFVESVEEEKHFLSLKQQCYALRLALHLEDIIVTHYDKFDSDRLEKITSLLLKVRKLAL